MKRALIVVAELPLTGPERESLAQLRDKAPGVTLFLMRPMGEFAQDDALFHRTIALPLGPEHLETISCIGMQLALNEGFGAVGVLRNIAGADQRIALEILSELAAGTCDVVVVREAGGIPDALFVSARAAFAASFWGALAEIAEDRTDILHELCLLTGRRLTVVREKLTGARTDHVPHHARNAVLTKHAAALARLIGIRVGAVAAPASPPVRRVAVITPYYKEPPQELARCLDSVRRQSYPCDHIMVSDGFPSEAVAASGALHLMLGVGHADNGNTPRYIGGLVAFALGYDAVAYLDADNWYEADHIESMVARQHETGANAVFSFRNIVLPDGFVLPGMDGEDAGRLHVDTSCYLLTRECLYAAHLWGMMPQSWGPVCDRAVLATLLGLRLAWTGKPSMNYQSNYSIHFKRAGRPLPEKLNDISDDLLESIAAMGPDMTALAVSRVARGIDIMAPRRLARARG